MPIEPFTWPSAIAWHRRRWLQAAAAAAALPASSLLSVRAEEPAAASTPASTPASDPANDRLKPWLERPAMTQAALSPDGKVLAAIGHGGGIPVAYVLDLATQKVTPISPTGTRAGRWLMQGYYPEDVRWIGADLLVLRMSNGQSFALSPAASRFTALEGRYVDRLADAEDGAERLLVSRNDEIHIVNLRTGARVKEDIDLPDEVICGALDAQGRLRAATTRDASRWTGEQTFTQWYRPPGAQAKWQKLETTRDFVPRWLPMRVLSDSETIAVWSRGDRDAYGVFRYDPRQRRFGELMAGHPTDDILSTEGLDAQDLDAVVTGGLKRQVYWFDERWSRLQRSVDAALPGALNRLSGQPDAHVLVHSRSDVDPGRWYTLDVKNLQLTEVGVARPDLEPARMRPMETYRYPARDGLKVPAYLTRPAGDGPAPMVVLIHGGPWARDDWGWDMEVQMLADEGYAVFQPQFRGSTGFGRAYEEAGFRQWGLSMQDDITDGVQQLIDRGVADPARLAIVGGSYGGYAAMWGLVKTPRLYRCGVSFAGISDLADFLTNHWDDDTTAATRLRRRQLVGDPGTARAQLDAVSPIRHAQRIQVPLLLAHGELDKRVLPEQSETMFKAMRRLGKDVEYLPLSRSGHGMFWPSEQRRYYGALLAFLRTHLGPPRAASAASQPA
ncbi:hypothetical protein CDN99_13840 [Roseateles aquatilis]|uniref:Peptidase S9 prolyl oligopeptidase catalytic domain-containing protein n=1 Tax=Roseateles aquatilis TaxID=431061 RepID=A0A246JCY0_9BURK|nr:S9 family peptidase [Roseateles aquatilis]OWQ90428.1 hypothetical protein CDN99_13840 [Roseateles aquatilis]